MATSEKRIEANRKNALLATGPRTPEGKKNSRKNSLKHGLTGAGVVLPAAMEAEIEAKAARWVEEMGPVDEADRELIGDTVRATVRAQAASRMESARRIEAASRALTCWQDDRRVAAEELALKLPGRPALVSRQLLRTLQGCELLIDRWHGLLRAAESGTPWDEARRSRALDLLGVPIEDREHHPRVHDKATAEELAAIARAEVEHLEGRRDGYLQDLDESERLMAETGLAFDDSPTGRRLWSYERTNRAVFLRGVVELRRRRESRGLAPAPRPRRSPSPTPAEPAPDAVAPRPSPVLAAALSVTIAPPIPAPVPAPSPLPPPAPAEPAGNRRQRRALKALARRGG